MAMKRMSEYGGMCVGIWVDNEEGEKGRKGRTKDEKRKEKSEVQ